MCLYCAYFVQHYEKKLQVECVFSPAFGYFNNTRVLENVAQKFVYLCHLRVNMERFLGRMRETDRCIYISGWALSKYWENYKMVFLDNM